MLTLQYRLDQLINDARLEFFNSRGSLVTDENVLGVLISTHFQWNGRACFETMQVALDDSNFHRVNRALGETWQAIEGANHD